MIYLDNASTTYPKPPSVVEAMSRYLTEVGASPGRGGYSSAAEAERLVEGTRRALTRLVGGDEPERMIFTANCTDALNMAFHAVLREGDHVVTTMLEHNSVNRPLQARADTGFITVTRVPFSASGVVDPDDIARALTPRTRLVVLNHASNVTGVIQPAAEVGALAHERGALFLLDAAQTIGLVDLDVQALRVDLLAFPAHKELLGPPGVGALHVGPRVTVRPWREGGTGGDSACPVQPSEWPFVLEAGTPNTVGIVGLQAALAEVRPAETLVHLRGLLARLVERITGVDGIEVLSDPDPACRVGTMSVRFADMAPEEVGAILDESFGICVRAGLHCAPYAHRQLGTFPAGTVRISPGPFTTADEIDQAATALLEIAAA